MELDTIVSNEPRNVSIERSNPSPEITDITDSKTEKGRHGHSKRSDKRFRDNARFHLSQSRSVSRSVSGSYSRSRSLSHSPHYSRNEKPRISSPRSPHRFSSKRKRKYYNSRSRSRSISNTPPRYRTGYKHVHNRELSPGKKRYYGNRDNPTSSRVLGVFGLSLDTTENEIRDVFRKYGVVEKIVLIYDHQTGRSRGFGFVYFEDIADAAEAKERLNGQDLDGRKMRVDYSITKRPHTPTPGVYMGKPSASTKRRASKYPTYDYYDREYVKHSKPSYYRSRSRSYSPYYSRDRYY